MRVRCAPPAALPPYLSLLPLICHQLLISHGNAAATSGLERIGCLLFSSFLSQIKLKTKNEFEHSDISYQDHHVNGPHHGAAVGGTGPCRSPSPRRELPGDETNASHPQTQQQHHRSFAIWQIICCRCTAASHHHHWEGSTAANLEVKVKVTFMITSHLETS